MMKQTAEQQRMFEARYNEWLENYQKMAILEDMSERLSYVDPNSQFELSDLLHECADQFPSIWHSELAKQWSDAGRPDPEDFGVVPWPANEEVGLTILDRMAAALYGAADAYLEQVIYHEDAKADTSDYLSVLEVINAELAKYGITGYKKDGKK